VEKPKLAHAKPRNPMKETKRIGERERDSDNMENCQLELTYKLTV